MAPANRRRTVHTRGKNNKKGVVVTGIACAYLKYDLRRVSRSRDCLQHAIFRSEGRRCGKMEFNRKLQELRKQKGITQEELAEALFVSRTAISKWESGRGYPSIESLKAISRYYSVSIDELLSDDEILTIAEETARQKVRRHPPAFPVHGRHGGCPCTLGRPLDHRCDRRHPAERRFGHALRLYDSIHSI